MALTAVMSPRKLKGLRVRGGALERVMRSVVLGLLIVAAVCMTMLTPLPQTLAACGYLEANRNPPTYYVGDVVQISGGGFMPNQDFEIFLSSSLGRAYRPGTGTTFMPLSVSSDSGGQVSFSIGPLPAVSWRFPVGTYSVTLWCSPIVPTTLNYASTNFFFAGQSSQ